MECPSGMVKDKAPRLTKKRLEAIAEALTEKLAGSGIPGSREPYEAAQKWADDQLKRRK